MKPLHTSGVYGIIGLGRFGFALAQTLAAAGKEVVVVDASESKVKEAAAFTDNAFVVKDLTREALEDCGVQNCDTVIVCIGEKIDTSVLTTLHVIDMGVKRVISKAISTEHGTILHKLGAEIVYPERDMAVRLALRLTSNHIMERISLSDEVDLSELRLTSAFSGKTVEALALRQRYGVNIIAINHRGSIVTEISPSTVLEAQDVIVVCGKRESIERLQQLL